MAEVYWIKHKDHVDVFTQGYVGFTSRDTDSRFAEHIEEARRNIKRPKVIHRAINKHGLENLEVKVLCICSDEYGLWLEETLRPTEKIGWNLAKGGGKPPGVKGLPVSKETREKLSKANKGKKRSQECIEKLRAINTGKTLSEDHRLKLSIAGKGRKNPRVPGQQEKITAGFYKALENNGWWSLREASLPYAEKADLLFKCFQKAPKGTIRQYCDCLGLDYNFNYEKLVRRFKRGWNPLEDKAWLKDFELKDDFVINTYNFATSFVSVQPWRNAKADKNVWSKADEFYRLFIEGSDHRALSKDLYGRVDKLDAMFKYFSKGWNPLEDVLWLQDMKEMYGS